MIGIRIREYLCRASEAGIGRPLPEELDEEELEEPIGVVSKTHPNIRGTDYYS
ncbi:MAG: hypothetical protein KJ768_04960 [Acidobacteria bacterium]|nr:hypothetical protein [Acidobacteriota bacterium]